MRKTSLLLIALCTLQATVLFAQGYSPATITLLSGKKEAGTIRYGYWGWGNAPRLIKFKSTDGNEKTLSVDQISAFEITRKDGKAERYVRKDARINRSSFDSRDLEQTINPTWERDTVFMLVLLEGDMSFYTYGERKQQFYFVETDTITELMHKHYIDLKGVPRINRRYQKQLQALTVDQPQLNERIAKTPYQEKPILKVIEAYIAAQNLTVRYRHAAEKEQPKFYFLGGVTASKIYFITEFDLLSYNKYDNLRTEWSVLPTLGAGFVYPVPRTNKKWNLVGELGLRSHIWKDTEKRVITDYAYDLETYSIKFAHARLSTMFRWDIFGGKNPFTVSLGMNNSIIVIGKSEETNVRFNNGVQSGGRVADLLAYKHYEFGWLVGAGYRRGRWGADVRFDLSSGIVKSAYVGAPIHTISMLGMFYF